MKQKLRKIKTLFLLTILSFVGCQPEEVVVEQGNYQNSFTIERISKNQFKKKAPKAFGKMELLNQNSSNNTHQRTVNINNEFSVDTDEIVQITKGNKVSYTLPIYRTIENGLVENLVLTLQNDNSFSAKIITYNLSQSEKDLLQNGMFVDVNNKMQVQSLDSANSIAGNIFARTSSDCFEVQTEYEMCCHNVHSTLDIQNGERCQCPNPPTGYTYTITAVACEEDNGGGDTTPTDTEPIDYNAPGDGTSSSGGNGDSSTGTGTPNDEDSTNNENEPVDNLGEEDLTIPIIRNPKPPTPCDELKTNSDDSTFKERMQALKDNVNGTKEKSFGVYNGDYNTPSYPNPSCGAVLEGDEQNGSPIPYHISLKATAHNHLKNVVYKHIGTFSPNDLIAFNNLIIEAEESLSPVKKNEFAIYLVCDEGNYALKLNDIEKLYNFAVKYGDENDDTYKDDVDNFYKEKNIIHGNPKQVQNIGFLKLLKEYDIGIDYYEADENFENWKKLELNSNNNNINETPC